MFKCNKFSWEAYYTEIYNMYVKVFQKVIFTFIRFIWVIRYANIIRIITIQG